MGGQTRNRFGRWRKGEGNQEVRSAHVGKEVEQKEQKQTKQEGRHAYSSEKRMERIVDRRDRVAVSHLSRRRDQKKTDRRKKKRGSAGQTGKKERAKSDKTWEECTMSTMKYKKLGKVL